MAHTLTQRDCSTNKYIKLVACIIGKAAGLLAMQCHAEPPQAAYFSTHQSYLAVNELTGLMTEQPLQSVEELVTMNNQGQRNLNRMWLRQHSDEDVKLRLDEKAGAKLLEMGLKSYWNQVKLHYFKDNQAVPDGTGQGKVNKVDYQVRLNANRLRVHFQYDF